MRCLLLVALLAGCGIKDAPVPVNEAREARPQIETTEILVSGSAGLGVSVRR
ncbi:MAG: hypothetical protein AAGE76_10160 [Pseudomonadota bacterium]